MSGTIAEPVEDTVGNDVSPSGVRTTDPANGIPAWQLWVFPLFLVVVVLVLTALRLSGTSIGVYQTYLYGSPESDDLLFADPQQIRSDEWLVMTQMTIAQARENFPLINQNITNGRDMSLIVDVPYRDWSIIFKPQNLGFFVLPLENAFALKWWSLLAIVALGGYAFVLHVLPGRPLLAVLLGTGFGLSPFLFWWYWAGFVACFGYSLLLIVLGMRIIEGRRVGVPGRTPLGPRASHAVHAVAMAYLAICFALLLYPPISICLILVVISYLLGHAAQARWSDRSVGTRGLLARLGVLAAAGVGAGLVLAAFVLTRREAIDAVLSTVYPGERVVTGGGYPWHSIFDTFLQPQLQRGPFPLANQSESSNFFLLMPYLIVAGAVVAGYSYRRTRRMDWPFVALHAVVGLFLMFLFVPQLQPLYGLLFLDLVPQQRVLTGLGLASFLYLVHLIRLLLPLRADLRLRGAAAGYALACLAATLAVGGYMIDAFPQFVSRWNSVAVYAVLFCAVIFLFLAKLPRVGAAVLLGLSAASVATVHPLYRGLGPVEDTAVLDAISEVSRPEDAWATVDTFEFENLALLAGQESVTGVQFYPDLEFWDQVDGGVSEDVYNRYAHVTFTTRPDAPLLAVGGAQDTFQVALECTEFLTENVDFLLAQSELTQPCTSLVRTVEYPTRTFYIYRVSDSTQR